MFFKAALPCLRYRVPKTAACRPENFTPIRYISSTQKSSPTVMLLEDKVNGFGDLRSNPRDPKPRSRGVTEIRGPYYSVMGKRYLQDVLETMGHHIDGLKFGGGSFTLYPEDQLRGLIDLAHDHSGGFIEHILAHHNPTQMVDRYLKKCGDLGFDVIELSTGFISFPEDDWPRLIERVQSHKLIPKPELGIQFGAGGDTEASSLESLGESDPEKLIKLGKRLLDMGVERIMIESEGITENVTKWRTDVIMKVMRKLGMKNVMFEAADPNVFRWYIREFGIDVNLFVDHSQIVQLSCLRSGIWGTADTWGKVTCFRDKNGGGI
ncbi:hypothetical protein RUND412_009649 [Rhizina undulata]